MSATSITADLRFSWCAESGRHGVTAPLTGSLTGSDSRLELQLSCLPSASIRSGRSGLRHAADLASKRGVRLSVRTPVGVVLEVGAGVRSSFVDRLVLRVPDAHVVSWSAFLRARRADRGVSDPVLLADLLPPGTLWPLSPTFAVRRQGRRGTHDAAGGGRPRLFFAATRSYEGEGDRVFYLKRDGVVLGSAEASALRLPGLLAQHAIVTRNEDDEYFIGPTAPGALIQVNGAPITVPTVLRTGTKIEIGDWRMSYFREEWADHGRPFSGRVGGELGVQHSQQRPTYR